MSITVVSVENDTLKYSDIETANLPSKQAEPIKLYPIQSKKLAETRLAEEFSVNEPLIIGFPGANVSKDTAINGTKKFLKELLPTNLHNQTLVFPYQDLIDLSRYRSLDQFTKRSDFSELANDEKDRLQDGKNYTSNYALDFMLAVLAPRVSVLNSNNITALPFEEAKSNLSQVLFISHCRGALFAQAVANALVAHLEKIGFSNDRIAELTKCIRHMAVAPYFEIKDQKQNFYTVNIIAKNDPIANHSYLSKEETLQPNTIVKLCGNNMVTIASTMQIGSDDSLAPHRIYNYRLTKSNNALSQICSQVAAMLIDGRVQEIKLLGQP